VPRRYLVFVAFLTACAQRPIATPRAPVAAPVAAVKAAPASSPVLPSVAGPAEAREEESAWLDDAEPIVREVAELRGLRPVRHINLLRLEDRSFDLRVATATRGAPGPYLGLYDFTTHELLLRSRLDTRASRGVLAHEIVHALQDQRFGLIGEEAKGEQALALKALYEGDAMLLRERLAAKDAGVDETAFVTRSILAVEGLPSVEVARRLGAPAAVLAAKDAQRERLLFPYLRGFVFAWRLYARGGTRALDRAYAHPPATTREVLFPDEYLARL
jgi:hypothetical protein